ncbi:MAG TPA: hypothetical protein VGP07_06120 [Polyangia bacterium]|jgi:hypothetical protein
MSARLEALLIAERVLPEATVRAAAARQCVYGGGLDTALLEMGALTEAQIWARLAAVTGLPVPAPNLADGTTVTETPPLTSEQTARMRFVPVGSHAQKLNLLCAEPVATDDIRNLVAESGFDARLFVVPELRLMALRQRIYGEPLPQRYAPLLAQAMGVDRARKSFLFPQRRVPPPFQPPAPEWPDFPAGVPKGTPLEQVLDLSGALLDESLLDTEMEVGDPTDLTGERSIRVPTQVELLESYPSDGVPLLAVLEQTPAEAIAQSAALALCRRARDPEDKGRALALRALRQRMGHPVAQAFVAELRAAAVSESPEAAGAIESLAEMRDELAIPIFIAQLRGEAAVSQAARRALVLLTAMDFDDTGRWTAWWERNTRRPRFAWLLDALGEKDAAARQLAFEELRPLSDGTFGYSPDLPKRKREAARRRWTTWWESRSANRS